MKKEAVSERKGSSKFEKGNISLLKAKLYVALTFKVLSWLDLKYEVGADDCKMLLAGRKPLEGINLVGN